MESDLGIEFLEFLQVAIEMQEIISPRNYEGSKMDVEPRPHSHVLIDVHQNEHPREEDSTNGVSEERSCVERKVPRHPPEKEDEAGDKETD